MIERQNIRESVEIDNWNMAPGFSHELAPDGSKVFDLKMEEIVYRAYGVSFCSVIEWPNGTLWVSRREFQSQVNFCPITGREARTRIGETEEQARLRRASNVCPVCGGRLNVCGH